MNNGRIEKPNEQKDNNRISPTNRANHKDTGSNEGEHIESIYNSSDMITNNYFCFECGAIMTTKENKKQHELFESARKINQGEENQ
jgi:hypothetical protein